MFAESAEPQFIVLNALHKAKDRVDETKGYGELIIKFGISNISNYLFVDFTEFQKTPKYKEKMENSKTEKKKNY